MEAGLRELGEPERREVTRGYFSSALEILGVSAEGIRAVVKEHREAWRALEPEEVIALGRALVSGGTHEGRQAGYLVLEARKDIVPLLDRATLEGLGAGNDNWASVDTFATMVAGPAWREGSISDAVVREWADSDDVWWRRTAVVCTVALNIKSRGGTGDVERTLAVCRLLADDAEDMVVKGVSWALRSLVGHDPDAVEEFLAEHDDVLAARVKREVRNKLTTGKKN
jgi:3-methyladenine DNA glycosylase AlkD